MNMLVFCSNPINGGTARMFYEFVTSLNRYCYEDDVIYPCIDINNNVEIYKKIENLTELPIYSEENYCKEYYGTIWYEKICCKIRRFFMYSRIKKKNLNKMKEFIISKSIDCVIIHNGGYLGDSLCNQMLAAAYQCADKVSCRIFILHNDMHKNFFQKIFHYFYDKKINREATDIVTVSNYTKLRMKRMSFIDKDIKVIYNGLPLSACIKGKNVKQSKMEFNNENKHVLMVGNFLESKGSLYFLKMISELKKHTSLKIKIDYTIIGNVYDEKYYNVCTKYIQENNIQNDVKIVTGINNAAHYMSKFDVLVLPSVYDESFGLISCEAMANGVPVVAFACGGIPEVIKDGYDGYVVPISDVIGLADNVAKILMDENKAKRLSIQCKNDFHARFSIDAMMKRYIGIINAYRKQ